MNITLIVPTYNGGDVWQQWIECFRLNVSSSIQLVVIDSSSNDDTVKYARSVGCEPIVISTSEFNHGRTRNQAVGYAKSADILIFMTQDALLTSPKALSQLITVFNDKDVAAVCGRQIPHDGANPLATHARLFNYPSQSQIKTAEDIPHIGLKVAFMSNSFSAYRRDVFEKLGGFPESTILAEDMYMASKMILAGYKVAYCAEATVRHSHNYTPWEEFRRYFDTGVFHACEPWIQQQLGGASGEGLRFVKSEFLYLLEHAPLWIPRALLTTACKLIGYKLGTNYKMIPQSWRPFFSMYKSYWLQ